MIKQNKLFKNTMLKNKRGEDMLVDFWAILVFAIIILLFFILFSANRNNTINNEISTEFGNKDTEYMLNSFLMSPAIGFDSEKTVADIIIEDYINDDYARTDSLMKKYYSETKKHNEYPVGAIYLQIEGEGLFYKTLGKIEWHTARGGMKDENGKTYTTMCTKVSNSILPLNSDKNIHLRLQFNVYYPGDKGCEKYDI